MAALQTRHDRKYLIPLDDLVQLLSEIRNQVRTLEIDDARSFRYESVYFDTHSLATYHDAARSRPKRYKVRTRTYLDSETCALEVKSRNRRAQTVKYRLAYPLRHRSELTDIGQEFINFVLGSRFDRQPLTHSLTTHFKRSTLLIGSSNSRATIDTDLEWTSPAGETIQLPNHVLIETKTDNGPTSVDRTLWANHIRPMRVSKYSVGLATLYPELPANKWNRVLRSHFDWMPQRVG